MPLSTFARGLMAAVSLAAMSGAAFAADEAPNTVQSVVITAPREEVKARAKQENAPVIVDIQAAETIAKYPDYNAAEALGRIPGVSLSSDTGEGRFVNIRGIDANLNGATYGGVVLLNTNTFGTAAGGGGRAVEFDTVPTGAIDGILVYKTLSPDREAEGLGGQIELTPRSAKNLTKPFFEGQLGWGYENLHNHTGPFTADVAAGARFGFNNGHLVVEGDGQDAPVGSGWVSNPTPFSLVLHASRKDDRRGIDDIEGAYFDNDTPPQNKLTNEVDFRRYDYNRRRFGYGGEFDFKPNDNHSYFLRADVAGYIEHAHKNHFVIYPDGNTTQVGNVVSDTFTPEMQTADYDETHRNTVIAAGGSDRFNDLVIDYRAAYSRATFLENHYTGSTWDGADNYFVTYNNITNSNHAIYQLWQDAAHTIKFNPSDATQYTNAGLSRYYESDHDEENSFALNATNPLALFGYTGSAKAGVSARLRHKVVNDNSASGGTSDSLSGYVANSGQSDYYNGWYSDGSYLDIYKIRALANANLGPLTPYLKRDINDKENVYAAYGMYTVDIGKLTVLSGVRLESTDDTYRGFSQNKKTGSVLGYNTTSKSYTNAFPTIQLTYHVQPDVQVRATWSTGIARPGFIQTSNYAAADFSKGTPTVTRGNTNLQPTTGNNFDLDIEYYMPNGGIVQIGLFDKEFENYIFTHIVRNATDPLFNDPANITGKATGTVVSFSNESGYARGLEAAYHQKFTNLPGLFAGIGVDANFTVVDSRFLEYDAATSGTGLAEHNSLPGTSHITWNLAGFYELHGLELRLSTEYVGRSLFGLGGDKSLDTVQDKKLNMDLTGSYQFDKHWTAYFSAKNLTDAPLRYFEGSHDRPIQREFYGQTYEAGVRAKF